MEDDFILIVSTTFNLFITTKMAKKGKKYVEARAKVDAEAKYPLADAVALVKEVSYSKFVGSLELHVDTNANPKYNDQALRGTVVLPHGTGKTVKVAAFVADDKRDAAKAAGADLVGNTEIVDAVNKGDINFDILITTADQMRDLARIAKQLWPKGLMPSPKAGTVVADIAKAVDEFKKWKVEYKLDKHGSIHIALGKLNFDDAQLIENVETVLKSMDDNKPTGVKWNLIKKIYLAPTMGPGVQVQ